jgi:proline racemase
MSRKTFFCIDAHTCGNPVRVIAGGGPLLTGQTIFEKRIHFMNEFDWIRQGLMFEPRGNDMMSGSIIYPPSDPANDFAILFIETSGCLPMCGHSTIGTVTVAIEEGLIIPKTPGFMNIEAPAGLIKAQYGMVLKKVKWVRFTNVPSYLAGKDLEIDSPHLGKIVFDVAYGGNFYAIVDPQENFKGIENYTAEQLYSADLYGRQLTKTIHFHILKIQRLPGSAMYNGQVRPFVLIHRRVMPCSMVTRPLIAHHAEQVHLRAWLNGMDETNCRLVIVLYMKVLLEVYLPAE